MKIFGLDIGYGWTKMTLDTVDDTVSFCSVVHIDDPSRPNPTANQSAENGPPWHFPIDGKTYIAGPGTDALLKPDSRTLQAEYVLSDPHYALCLAALRMTKVPVIEHLAVGVPVLTPKSTRSFLKNALTGEHQLSNAVGDTCTVEHAHVLFQGQGAYIDHCFRATKNAQTLQARLQKTSLVIDVGFCTVDWLVLRGTTTDDNQCGSAILGARPILTEIAKAISSDTASRAPSMLELEAAIIHGEPLRVASEEINPKQYYGAAQSVVRQGIAEILATIRNASDIHEILLAGGGAHFYKSAIEEAFPRHNVEIVVNNRFANAQGYHRLVSRKFHGRS